MAPQGFLGPTGIQSKAMDRWLRCQAWANTDAPDDDGQVLRARRAIQDLTDRLPGPIEPRALKKKQEPHLYKACWVAEHEHEGR